MWVIQSRSSSELDVYYFYYLGRGARASDRPRGWTIERGKNEKYVRTYVCTYVRTYLCTHASQQVRKHARTLLNKQLSHKQISEANKYYNVYKHVLYY